MAEASDQRRSATADARGNVRLTRFEASIHSPPNRCLAADHEALLCRAAFEALRVALVEHVPVGGREDVVQVPARGEQRAVAGARHVGEHVVERAGPNLHDGRRRPDACSMFERLLPQHWRLPEDLRGYVQETFHKERLERRIVARDAGARHERCHVRIALPAVEEHIVAAQMHEPLREEVAGLAQQLRHERVRAVTCWVHRGHRSVRATSRVTALREKLAVVDAPRIRVSWRVPLGHHSNPAEGSVLDDSPHIVMRVDLHNAQ